MLSTIGRYTLFWVVALVILPLILLSATVYKYSKDILEEEILSSLRITSEGLKSRFLLALDMKKARAMDFSSDGFIRESLRKINSGIQPEKNSAGLSAHLSRNKAPLDPDIYDIFVFDGKGRVAASTNDSLAKDVVEKESYFESGKNGLAVGTIESLAGERHFSVSAPLTGIHTNETLGVITLRYRASLIDEALLIQNNAAQSRLHRDMLAYITDRDNIVLAGPSAHLGRRADTDIAKQAFSSGHAEGEFLGVDGVRSVGAASLLGGPDWLVVVYIPTETAFAPLGQLAGRAFLLIAPFTLLSIAAALVIARRVSKPIVEVADAAEKIANGGWDERVEASGRKGETLRLANSFNSMVARLHDSFAALEESRLFNKNIVEAMPMAIVVMDKDLRIVSVNKGFGRIFGLHAASAQGQSAPDLLDRFGMDRVVIEAVRAARGLGDMAAVCRADKKGFDRDRVLCVSTAPTGAEGRTLLVMEDITQRKEAEEELRQSREQLREAQKMEALGRLSGGIAHDFNNILTAIMGYTDLQLMRYEEGHPMRPNMEKIKKASERARGLTTQLLAFSRKQVINPAPLDLNSVINGMHDMIERLIGENVKLQTNLCPHATAVMADKNQIEQVILNLAVNAKDAMPGGGVITIETLVTDKDKPKSLVCMSVSDTGTGMDKALQKRIFEPFFSTKGTGKGTGLGLATTYGIVKQHGGWIEVQSSPGQGSTFKVYLPAVSEKAATAAREVEATAPEGLKGSGENVLLVEDELGVRDYTALALLENGYNVETVPNAEEGIVIYKNNPSRFDLILSDIVLPGESGLKLSEEVLSLMPGQRIILTSGYIDEKGGLKTIERLKVRFLAKPYSLSELLSAVKEALK